MGDQQEAAWYAVTSVWASAGGGFYATLLDTVSTGKDPITVVKRRRLALEQKLFERTGLRYADDRPGSMYAVWKFEEKVTKRQAVEVMRDTHPWRVLVITRTPNWQYMAELCLPPDVDLFAHEKEEVSDGRT